MSNRFKDPRHIKWARAVKKKFNYQCDICGQGGILHSHHVNSYDWCTDQRFDIDNGICLCKFHHEQFHKTHGAGNNTYDQYLEFKEVMKVFKKNIEKK